MELNHRFRRIRTKCFRYTTKRVGVVRIELTVSCAQDTRATSALHPELLIDPCGIRTQPNQFEGLATSPEVERALSKCAESPSSLERLLNVGRKALESFSPGLQPGAKPSQLPARKKKKPGVFCVTPGF